ncbi:MAG TPA: hypothetical protein VD969_19635 [Symbiobacteriaceae bacterium]|nr:hypothetical protein [Symbiobacteriaceae bacterium]
MNQIDQLTANIAQIGEQARIAGERVKRIDEMDAWLRKRVMELDGERCRVTAQRNQLARLMQEAVDNCETCRDTTMGPHRCARCQTFAEALAALEAEKPVPARKYPPMAGGQDNLEGKFCRFCGCAGGELQMVRRTDGMAEEWEHPGCRPGARNYPPMAGGQVSDFPPQFTTVVLEPAYVCVSNGCYAEASSTPTGECPECGEELRQVKSLNRYHCNCGGWTWVNAECEHTEQEEGTYPVCCPECGAKTGTYSPA